MVVKISQIKNMIKNVQLYLGKFYFFLKINKNNFC